jgi:hypothetical protein
MATFSIHYGFTFEDNSEERFHLQMDSQCCELVDNLPGTLPSWTQLTFQQCPHCPLQPEIHPHCPLAANLAGIITKFSRFLPYEKTYLTVVTEERQISEETTIQAAVGSLMGIVSATSGCPYMAYFKPMARFHLPLASTEETIFRSVSMYLMAQYFLHKEGHEVDFSLQGLTRIYENAHTVNTTMAERFLAASKNDSSIDAVVQLDIYAMTFLGILDEPLEELRPLFNAFFRKEEE